MQVTRARVIPPGTGRGRTKGHKKKQTGIRLASDVEASLEEAKAAGHTKTDALMEGYRVGRDAQKAMGPAWGEVLAISYRTQKPPGTVVGELAAERLKQNSKK